MVFHLSHVIEPLYIQRARRCASIRELVFPEQKNVSHSNLCLFHFPSLFTFSCYSTHFPSTKKHFVNHLDFGKFCKTSYFASNGWKKSLALNYFSSTLPYLQCQFATMQDDATTLCLRNLCYYYCGECVRVHCAH